MQVTHKGKASAKASTTNDCNPGIPVADDNSAATYKDIDPAKQRSKLFGERESLGSVFPAKQAKEEEKKAKIDKERRQKLTTNKKKKHQFRQKSQTANHAEFPKEGCPV